MSLIFINAGHHTSDSGVIANGHFESKVAIDLRNKIVPLLRGFGIVHSVPDDLNLKESIAWVNKRAEKGDLAFSIHLNSHNNKLVNGTEAYYSNEREEELAITFASHVSKSVGFRNRGAKHDSLTWVGSLGWLRKLKCDSVLVEVCYFTSELDMKLYNADKIAQGFVDAVKEVLQQQKELPEIIQKKLTLIGLLKKLVELLQRQLDLIIKNNK